MRIPLKLIPAEGFQHYDCTGCGDCCRGRFAIIVTPDDRARIEAQGWTDNELSLRGRPLFMRRGEGYQLAHRADGACVFLTPDNRCAIHARYGEAAKPLACRLYPFTFVPTGQTARVDVRFDCPATASNIGRPITAHHPELLQLLPDALPNRTAVSPPPLREGVSLTWEQLRRVTQAVEQVLLDVSLPITARVAACVSFADNLRRAEAEAFNNQHLGGFVEALAADVQARAAAAEDRTAPPPNARWAFRQLLGVYGHMDTVGGRANLWRRLNVAVRMLAGRGAVPPIRDGFPTVTFNQIDTARGVPSGEAASALERYLHTHLSSMGFCGETFYGRPYLDGLSALLLTYPITCWYARAFALAAGLSVPDRDSAEQAIMIVGHQHGITPLLDLPTERTRTRLLCEPDTLRALTLWYGS